MCNNFKSKSFWLRGCKSSLESLSNCFSPHRMDPRSLFQLSESFFSVQKHCHFQNFIHFLGMGKKAKAASCEESRALTSLCDHWAHNRTFFSSCLSGPCLSADSEVTWRHDPREVEACRGGDSGCAASCPPREQRKRRVQQHPVCDPLEPFALFIAGFSVRDSM